MRLKLWIVCLAACFAFAATADAQPGGGRGGGRGGPGGRGMGRGGILFIAGNEAVQKDLALSDEVAGKVKTVLDDFRAENQAAMPEGGFQAFRDMSEEDRKKYDEKTTEIRNKFLGKLKDTVTADQYTRLQQINYQNMRAQAYTDPDVVKALTITEAQTEKITAINTEYMGKFGELFRQGAGGGGGGGGGGGPSPEIREKMTELGKEQTAKIAAVLTKEQNDKFTTMKGKEFDLTQLNMFGGPGGGGGRGKRPQQKSET